MDVILLLIGMILLVTSPIYVLCELIASIYRGHNKVIKNIRTFLDKKSVEYINMFFIVSLCILGLSLSSGGVSGGKPLTKYSEGGFADSYSSLSPDHILTVAAFFIFGLISYKLLKLYSNKLSPIIYTLCCSILIINIIFTVVYYLHTRNIDNTCFNDLIDPAIPLKLGFTYLSLLYIARLKWSLDEFIKSQRSTQKKYKNKLLNLLYAICTKYYSAPIVWIISLFPVLILIQLILVIFGQQPNSFIKVFFDTSNFNYSKLTAPDPIIVSGDGHYLCTVSVKGHKKLVKPMRMGIRRGRRIIVNRQLLVANAFENVLEDYTPKLHRFIRYIYDKYGFPLSNYINTKLSADIVYLLMKPLECFFILVLYIVERSPEDKINIQYSELRK